MVNKIWVLDYFFRFNKTGGWEAEEDEDVLIRACGQNSQFS